MSGELGQEFIDHLTSFEGEGQRQLTLMALAHLAIESPGFDYALSEIAKRFDNVEQGKPVLYERFKELHKETLPCA